MDVFLRAVTSVLIVFLLTALGYLGAARGWIDAGSKRFINSYLMKVGIPMMCIYELSGNLDRSEVAASLPLLLAGFLSLLLTLGAAYLVERIFLRGMPRERSGVFLMLCCVSNAIFFGLAMCTEIFGAACTPHVMVFYLANTTMIQLVCQPILRKTGTVQGEKRFTVLDMLKLPTVQGVLAGYAIVLLDIRLPYVLSQTAMYLSRTVTPLALLVTGYIIHDAGLKNLRVGRDHLAVMLFRFLICPAIGALLCLLLRIDGLARGVLLVELAMPVVTMTAVYASAYGADERFAAESAAMTTLACFFVIPILVLLL